MATSESAVDHDGSGAGNNRTGGSPSDRFNNWKGPTKVHFSIVTAILVIVVGVAVVILHTKQTSSASTSQLRASGIPASVSTPLANLMQLSPIPKTPAPNFTLTDQNGKTYSMSSFRGQAVVLEFMDPNCTDICPLIAQEFVDAYHNLGTSASKVTFLAVNVNKYHLSTAAVARFTNEHGLTNVPTWHFLTGSESALSKIWKDYGISVESRGPTADVIHTSLVYFIGPNGHQRYLASPVDYHTPQGAAYLPASQLTQWGQGIAIVSKQLL